MPKQRLKTILIDDEPDCLALLNWQIEQKCLELEVVALCQSTRQASLEMVKHTPDVVFLDIEMPDTNGLQFLQSLSSINFEPIFTTAYSQYAIRAIKLGAFDYLLKPIQGPELKATVERLVQKRLHNRPGYAPIAVQHLIENLNGVRKKPKITIQTAEEVHFLDASNMLYLQSESNYTHIFLHNSRPLLVARTLKYFEELLTEYGFFRVHASYLVNLDAVRSIRKGESGGLVMSDGVQIPIARSRRDKLMELL